MPQLNFDSNCKVEMIKDDSFPTACGVGACARTGICTAGNDSCRPGAPTTEICDAIDNNCDGDVDEGFDVDADGRKEVK
jgi:hypothetical protein